MQVRPTVMPATYAAPKPLAAPAAGPAPKQPIKARNADPSFGMDIFQSTLYALMNVGQIVNLGFLSGLVQMLPKSSLGVFNLVLGGMNAFRDWQGMAKPNNTRLSDDYTRLAGDGAIVLGGLLLLGGGFIAPVVPLIGAGIAGAGYLARAVGIWNDESRW